MYHNHHSIANREHDTYRKSQGMQDRRKFLMPNDLPNYQTTVKPILEEMSGGKGGLDTIKRQLQELKNCARGDESKTNQRNLFLSETQLNNKNYHFSRGINRMATQNYRLKGSYAQERQSFVNISELQRLLNFDLRYFYSRIANYILFFKSSYRPPIVKALLRQQYCFKKAEILLMLCLMSTFLIPSQNATISGHSHKRLDFSHIFANEAYKTRCIFEFMSQMLSKTNEEILTMTETMTVRRIVSYDNVGSLMHKLGRNKQMVNGLTIKSDNDDIEGLTEMVKVDFANKHLGGGALERGLVQQEIIIANRPELYPITLLCEQMGDNEAIGLIGFRKYFKNRGYSDTTTYDGRQQKLPHFKDYIVAIDATHYRKFQTETQYQPQSINRELLKAYTGFSGFSQNRQPADIASGNWGCGAFNGDPQLKLIIQWIASSLNNKQVHICPFGKKGVIDDKILLKQLKGRNIKQVYDLLMQTGKVVRKNSKVKLYDAMLQSLRRNNVPKDTDYYPQKDDWERNRPIPANIRDRHFKSLQKLEPRDHHFNKYFLQQSFNPKQRRFHNLKLYTNPNYKTNIEIKPAMKQKSGWNSNTKVNNSKPWH